MQQLPNNWIQNITCDLQPARCLNTLYHLLKKVSVLQEGRYLLVHKPREGFVTIFKASDETKAARGVFHLQNAHCGPPAVTPGIPWIPLDPSHILPFHQKHCRPPCIFPPRPPPPPKVGKGPKQRQGNNTTNQNKSTKKKHKKGANMKNKQVWMDNMRVKLMKDLQKNQTIEGGTDGKP
ncbi:little elongation complex subunit 2 [Garra rufa]|uniref:little elongation complex subunit 2 n=1 Tax=Garra rufa TaxID=137080 RepID=UPI003CCEE683